MTSSFSKCVKEQLCEAEVKKKCCKFTLSALEPLAKESDNSALMRDVYDKCRCDGCRTVFWRFMFEKFGSVTDPNKSYHMEFSFPYESECETALEFLAAEGMNFKKSKRRNRFILYQKESAAIEDFLVYIGASGAAFDVMNSKIMHDFRNSINRQVNCDTANIGKQLNSVKKYTDAIEYLINTGKIDSLTPEIKETAILRLEHKQLSLNDLCNHINPPVTKSGLRHRLDKILAIAEQAKSEDSRGES